MFHSHAALRWALLLVLALVPSVRADRPGFYSGDFPGGGARSAPANPPSQQPPRRDGRGWHGNRGIHFGVGPGYYAPYYGYPYYGPGWGYPGYPYGTGIYYDPTTNRAEYYLPPVYVPGELMFGPLATERFLGIRRDPLVVPPGAGALPGVLGENVAPADIVDKLRKSNDRARERARSFMAYGDALFQRQQFHTALQRYKSAIEAAPDLVEAYLRQGFALIAVNQYRLAAKALRIAVELDPEYIKGQFRLDDLYGENGLAQTTHLETLANSAIKNPDNADLLFLVGMMLYANGEPERAQKFLTKAAQIGGPEAARLINPLLGNAAPAENVPAQPDNAPGVDT